MLRKLHLMLNVVKLTTTPIDVQATLRPYFHRQTRRVESQEDLR